MYGGFYSAQFYEQSIANPSRSKASSPKLAHAFESDAQFAVPPPATPTQIPEMQPHPQEALYAAQPASHAHPTGNSYHGASQGSKPVDYGPYSSPPFHSDPMAYGSGMRGAPPTGSYGTQPHQESVPAGNYYQLPPHQQYPQPPPGGPGYPQPAPGSNEPRDYGYGPQRAWMPVDNFEENNYGPHGSAPYAARDNQPPLPSGPDPSAYGMAMQPQRQPQVVAQQPSSPVTGSRSQAQADPLLGHAIELTRASATGKVIGNNATIPRFTPEMLLEDAKKMHSSPTYITPASRKSLRLSFSTVPATPALAESIGFPTCVMVRPLAEEPLPLVDFASLGEGMTIVRCRKCRTYINPYTTFCENGRRWQCIFCKCFNETPPRYQSPLSSATGQREDLDSRPELLNSSVEFVAPAEYMVRPPQRPVYLFLMEFTHNAVSTGLLKAQCRGAIEALRSLREDESIQVAIVGFNSNIYFFPVDASKQVPTMLVDRDLVNDIGAINDSNRLEPIELPCLASDLVVSVKTSYEVLVQLLEKIPILFKNTKDVGCAFGPALNAAMTILEKNGGKIIASLASLPSIGDGKLKARFDKKLLHQPKEHTLCATATSWYKERALACSNAQISVDIIAGGGVEIDLTSVAPLARFTSGHLYRVSPVTFHGLQTQIKRILTRDTCFESLLRIRCSDGVTVSNSFGHCYVRGPDLVVLPVTDSDMSYTLQLSVNAPTAAFVYVQIALLYTSRSRERRIRIHTIQLRTSTTAPPVLNSADSIALAAMMCMMCIDYSASSPFQQAQQKITEMLVSGFRNARKHITVSNQGNPPGVLIVPEPLKYLPQFISGFFRHPACRVIASYDTSPDERVASMATFMCSPPDTLLPYYCGWTYCMYSPRIPPTQLPRLELSSQDSLRSDSVYVIHIGSMVVVWYGRNTPTLVLNTLGLTAPSGASPSVPHDMHDLPEDAVQLLSARYHELLAKLKELGRSTFTSPIILCAQGSVGLEKVLAVSLTDDDMREATSLASYLAVLQQKVMAA